LCDKKCGPNYIEVGRYHQDLLTPIGPINEKQYKAHSIDTCNSTLNLETDTISIVGPAPDGMNLAFCCLD
jgi:hypothetical protein